MGKRLKEANAFQKITIFAMIFMSCVGIYSANGEYIMSRLGYDARSTGMGETGYLYNNRTSVIAFNPAGISDVNNQNIHWTRTAIGKDSWSDYISYVSTVKLNAYGFAVGVFWHKIMINGVPDNPEDSILDISSRVIIYGIIKENMNDYYYINESGLNMIFGGEWWSFGATVRTESGAINHSSTRFQGVGTDIGLSFTKQIESVIDDVGICLVVKDLLGTRIKWMWGPIEKTNSIYNIIIGIKSKPISWSEKPIIIEFKTETDTLSFLNLNNHLGVELYVHKNVPIQIGFNGEGLTYGIGFQKSKVTVNFGCALKGIVNPTYKYEIEYRL